MTNVCTWNWSTGSWPSSLSAALVFGDASATCGLLSHCARCRRCGHVGVRLFAVPPSGVPVESPSVRGMIKSPSAENVLGL